MKLIWQIGVVQWCKSNRTFNNWYKTLCPTWSTQDNTKLLQQLKSSLKRKINYNKYQSKVSVKAINSYLDYWIDPSFQGENNFLFYCLKILKIEQSHKKYYLPSRKIKDYNLMNDEQNICDQPIKNDLRTYDNIPKSAIGQGNDNAAGCLFAGL